MDTLYPSYHLELKFRAEKEFGQAHDFDENVPFKLQMSQLVTTLTSWENEMRLTEKKPPRILRINHVTVDDYSTHDETNIFALSEDLKCDLCGRTGHENISCHKFMNHTIGDALMKAHPRETARIIRENKKNVTIGPRGTPRNGGERTDHRPPSVIRMVNTLPESCLSVNDIEPEIITNGATTDNTVQITRISFEDQSEGLLESEGTLDYDHIARIVADQDVSMGVRYDGQLIDCINANWDEELLATTYNPDTWPIDCPPTELVYDEDAEARDGFYDAHEDIPLQGKDMPTIAQS
jgi:hypothetical protein